METIQSDCRFPQLELQFYIIIWISAVFFSIYSFAKQADHYFEDYFDDYSDFSPGWSVLYRKQDNSDYEWTTTKYLIGQLYLWMILNIITMEILRKLNLKILQYWQIFVSIVVIIYELNVVGLLIIVAQPVVFLLSMRIGRNTIVLWLCNLLLLLLITVFKSYSFTDEFFELFNINDRKSYLLTMLIFWMNLKCFSYNFDCVQTSKDPKSIEFFAYCLYLPTLFCGPFIKYKNYHLSIQNHRNSRRFIILFLNICRFCFWVIFVEFCLHYIYVNAISFHPEWVESFSSWSLYGYGYTMGQFFHIKYVVLYGLSTSLAQFDGVEVPQLPICIGRVHLYSDMWKYFDVGLYDFLITYIYIPAIKNRLINNKIIASFLCFSFVYLWHGTDIYILLWACFNFLAICIETVSKNFYKKFIENTRIECVFGENWIRRISCLLTSPLLAFSAISNFYFFARIEIGNIFLQRIFNDSWYSTCILLALLYCCCQVSTELRIKLVKSHFKNYNYN